MPVWVTLRRARADFLGLNDKCDLGKLLTEAYAFFIIYCPWQFGATAATKVPSPGYVLDGLHIWVRIIFISLAQGARIPFDVSYCLSGLRRADAVLSAISGGGCSCIHHFTVRDNGGKSSSVLVSSANREPLIGEALAHHVLDVVIEGRTYLW